MSQLSMTLNLPRHERYLFESKLAQGGNGVIYRAVDKVLGRKLVIKMILESALPDDLTKRWFFREAQVASQLNHPNIVTIYDLSELDGQPYIAMEYVEGVDLSEHLDDKLPMTPAAAAPLFKPLTAALQYAHDRKVVHRDIKLENVMLTPNGDIKLMDFGLAKAMQGGTKTVVVAGTPSYMSPEQIMNDAVDHRTDIYAIGVMLFKVLTGRFPFEGGSEVLIQHVTEPAPDILSVNAGLPKALSAVIAKALAKEKKDRYDRVEDLYNDFAKVCHVA
jgi:serine/threonine-protein kinase